MYDEIIKEILESIGSDLILHENYPKFSGKGYKPYKIEAKNFHQIKKPGICRKIAFVDGGNAEIIGSANFSLNLIRVCCAIYQNNEKMNIKKLEFFAFINATNKNDEIYYKVSFYGAKNSNFSDKNFLNELSFNSFDKTLMLGINRAEIGSIANALRRFAELKMAKIISEGNFCDIIVLDGDLQAAITHEKEHMDELHESCSKNNVVLAAISKTSSLFTDNGNLLSAVLDKMAIFPSWFYHPLAEIDNINHKADMYFVKFHDKSRHAFRLEIFNLQKANAEDTINILAGNCIDPIFLGYPYGLVEADRMARVSNSERESLRTIFLFKLRNRDIEKYFSSVNAHEILDRARF